MDTMHRRYKRRLVLYAMAALVAVMAVLQCLAYHFGQKDIRGQLETSAKSVAVSVAQMLMADIDEYRAFLDTKDPDAPYYKKMRRLFAAIREESDVVRYIYTERRLDADTTEYILDAEPMGSKDYSPPGKLETMDPEKEITFSQKAYTHNVTDDDKWGSLITAYAPILDEGGEVLGLVGVDIEGKHLRNQLLKAIWTMIALNLIIVCLSLALLMGFSDAILDYMTKDRLTRAFTEKRFKRELVGRISHSAKHGQQLALIMVEPDLLGHDGGGPGEGLRDRALVHVSRVMRNSIRPGDCLAHYGNKGLALIMADTGAIHVRDVAERLRQTIEDSPMPAEGGGGGTVRATVSIGVVVSGDPPQSADDLVGERALGQAKAKGNAVAVLGAGETG